jgi:hypothetical protein
MRLLTKVGIICVPIVVLWICAFIAHIFIEGQPMGWWSFPLMITLFASWLASLGFAITALEYYR